MDPEQRVGAIFAGKYRLERLLGVGGMGAVYEAVHVGVEKRFAIKLVRADVERSRDSAERFTQEARAAARIGHPNLVEVFDLGEAEDGTLYMVMELLLGQSLAERLREGALPVADAMAIGIELLGALDAAHRAGFVHRDIKPANIFLVRHPSGRVSVKVLDFGIAKLMRVGSPSLTQSGVVVGTPLYMAPEQVMADREVDGRADLWAVGAALFEMLTDRPVHLAPNATAAAVKVVTEVAPRVSSLRPEVDAGIDAIVARALAVAREDRYASAAEMLAALQGHGTSLGPTLVDGRPSPMIASGAQGLASARSARPPAHPPGRGLVLLGVASIVLGALATVAIVRRTGRLRADEPQVQPLPATLATAAPPVSAIAEVPLLAAVATSTASASPIPKAPPASATPPLLAPASSASTHVRTACAAGEHVSKDHCCSVGLEWQADRCDRPLATKVTF